MELKIPKLGFVHWLTRNVQQQQLEVQIKYKRRFLVRANHFSRGVSSLAPFVHTGSSARSGLTHVWQTCTCNEQQRRGPIDTQETSFKRRLLSRRDANDSCNVMFRRNGNRKDRGDYDDSSPRWMTHPGSRNTYACVVLLFPLAGIKTLEENVTDLGLKNYSI